MATRTSTRRSATRSSTQRSATLRAGRTQRNSIQSITTTIFGSGYESGTIPLSSGDIIPMSTVPATVPMSVTRRATTRGPYRQSAFAPTIRSGAITEVEQFETRPQTIVHNVWPEEMVGGISTRKGRATGWQIAAAGAVFLVGGYLMAKVMGP